MLSTDGVCFALDDDGNLIVPLRRITGVDAVRQGCNSRLQMFKREWFLDQGEGMPWVENENDPTEDHILGATYNEEKARFYARKAILATPATNPESLVLTLSYDGATRALDIEYEVTAVFDDVATTTRVQGNVTIKG